MVLYGKGGGEGGGGGCEEDGYQGRRLSCCRRLRWCLRASGLSNFVRLFLSNRRDPECPPEGLLWRSRIA